MTSLKIDMRNPVLVCGLVVALTVKTSVLGINSYRIRKPCYVDN